MEDKMATTEMTHYATLIRLQTVVTALQDLLTAAPHPRDCERDGMHADQLDAYRAARANASAALQIAFGGSHEIPAALTDRWTNRHMADHGSRILRENA